MKYDNIGFIGNIDMKNAYGPKTKIKSHDILHPSKVTDYGQLDYDYVRHHKTGEIHQKILSGPHKGKYIPTGLNKLPNLNKAENLTFSNNGQWQLSSPQENTIEEFDVED